MFYNSEDGGQTNVKVEVLTQITKPINCLVIFGKDLIGSYTVDGLSYLLVAWETVTDNPTATITRLHR